jgi:hypothetical protein
MQPGEVYVLAIVATAVLVAPFNALARVIVLVWCGSHLAFLAGAPEVKVNLIGHLIGFLVGACYLRTDACLFALGWFVPMIAADVLRLIPANYDEILWWVVLISAGLQLLFLPFGIEWAQVKALRERGLSGWWQAMPHDYWRKAANG